MRLTKLMLTAISFVFTIQASAQLSPKMEKLIALGALGGAQNELIGKDMCVGAGVSCYSDVSIGKAICEVAGVLCYSDIGVGQAICKAAGINCYPDETISSALCKSRVGSISSCSSPSNSGVYIGDLLKKSF